MRKLNNLVVVSDIHCGCRLGLLHPDGIKLDDGGLYQPSEFQILLWDYWREFWDKWVPNATRNEPYAVCFNGDALDGVHHKATHQISHNLSDQAAIAEQILAPIVKLCKGRYYHCLLYTSPSPRDRS